MELKILIILTAAVNDTSFAEHLLMLLNIFLYYSILQVRQKRTTCTKMIGDDEVFL